MKNLTLKASLLLLLCSIFTLSSCKKGGESAEKSTVTLKYRIMVSADQSYKSGLDGGAIEELYIYTKKEIDVVSKAHDKESWTITETAATEKEAIAACDKKAIAVFDEKITAINEAAASVKAKFDAKKAELLSKIAAEPTTAHVKYDNYGGHLFKGNTEDLFPSIVVKEGTLYDLEAVGGEK